MNCPIREFTADGAPVGRCFYFLEDGKHCPRHGDVSVEVEIFNTTGKTTTEYDLRRRLGSKSLDSDKGYLK